jgi:8-oxo-dGTP diphosphatase
MTTVVVGVALFTDGPAGPADPAGRRVLAACRAAPPELAGRWEFPGGKVEPGETDAEALLRECREELGVEVELGPPLGEVVLPSGAPLRVWRGRVVAGVPLPLEHRELRWLSAAQLDDVPWIPADLPLVDALRPLLAG